MPQYQDYLNPSLLMKYATISRLSEPVPVNFVAHGFASHLPEGEIAMTPNENKIYITKEGLLTGEILNEIDDKRLKLSYEVWSYLWGHVGAWLLLVVLVLSILKLLTTL